MSTPPVSSPKLDQVLTIVRWLLLALVVVLSYIVLAYLAGVLAPILAALGIAYLLNPVLEKLVAKGMRRSIGASLLLFGFVGLLVAAIIFLAPRAATQVTHFFNDLPRLLDNFSQWTDEHFGLQIPSDWKAHIQNPKTRAALTDSSGPARLLAEAAIGGVFELLGALAEMALVPVFAFYFLVDWPNILRRFDHMVPPRRRGEVRDIVRQIDRVVAGWVRGQAIVTSILAVCYAIGFSIVDMPLSLPIGLVVGALTVIPFVGTLVGAAIALMVVIGNGNMNVLAGVAIVFVVLHLFEAGVLTPKIVGHRVGLSESGALLAVVAGGKLLGFVGVVLAVPIAATVAVLVRYLIKQYELSSFYGHESDADVVITPAMALIMPGIALGAKIVADQPKDPVFDENATAEPPIVAPAHDDWGIAPDALSTISLGPPGTTRPSESKIGMTAIESEIALPGDAERNDPPAD